MSGKARFYSIAIVILIYLLISSIPFSLFVQNELYVFLLKNVLRLGFIVFSLIFIKKNELYAPLFERLQVRKCLITIPFLLICFSNFIVILVSQLRPLENINHLSLLFAIISSVFVSVCEEIIFRSVLLAELTDYQSPVKALLISSLIFGIIHLVNITSVSTILPTLLQALYSIGTGFVFGFLYLYHKNIIVPIFLHLAFNVVNNDLVTVLYQLEWDYLFFLINVAVALSIVSYLLFLFTHSKYSVIDDLSLNHDRLLSDDNY